MRIGLRVKFFRDKRKRIAYSLRGNYAGILRESKAFHKRKKNIRFRVGLMETYQFGKKYDVIFSVYSLVHSFNQKQALANILNHLKKGGIALIGNIPKMLLDESYAKKFKEIGFKVKPTKNDALIIIKEKNRSIKKPEKLPLKPYPKTL